MRSTSEKPDKIRIAIGSDHGGFDLKQDVVDFLKAWRYKIKDFGTRSAERCDYPSIGYKVASGVAAGKFTRGILICKSGIGMCIVANKVRGIRAALLSNAESARLSREHNDANVLSLGARFISEEEAMKAVELWLKTPFSGELRHKRRIKKID